MSNSNFSILTPFFSRDGFYESCFQNPSENSGIVHFVFQGVAVRNYLNYDEKMSLKIDFNIANSADTDEMLPYAAFYLGLHCLPMYLLICIWNEKG